LLSKANIKLTKATEIVCSIEAAEIQSTQLKGTSRTSVMNVRSNKTNQRHNPEKHRKQKTVTTEMSSDKCNKQGHFSKNLQVQEVNHNNTLKQHSQHAIGDNSIFQVLYSKSSKSFTVNLHVHGTKKGYSAIGLSWITTIGHNLNSIFL